MLKIRRIEKILENHRIIYSHDVAFHIEEMGTNEKENLVKALNEIIRKEKEI